MGVWFRKTCPSTGVFDFLKNTDMCTTIRQKKMESDAEKTVLVHFGELARPVTFREDKLFPAAVRERFKEIPAISAPGRKLTFQVKCLASPPPPPPFSTYLASIYPPSDQG